ncbi:MAG: DMT family transporter [Rhizobiaceae bacterium]|nr:DMT family transporter [Rhizobiaceae bacterium]
MIKYFPALFVVLWSTGFIGARMGMPYAEPASFLSLRYVIAIVVLGAIVLVAGVGTGKAKWPDWRLACHSMVVGVFLHGIYLGAVFWVIDHGFPAGISSMIIGLQPLVVAFFAGSLLGETVSRRNWQGLLIGLVGLCLVIVPKIEFGTTGITPFTVAITVMAMLASTFGTIYQKKYASHVDVRTGTIWQYIGALIPSLIYASMFESFSFEWNGELIFALGWLVLVLSIAAVFMLLLLIRDGSVSQVSALFYLVPTSTAIIAYFLFGETLNMLQLSGMVLCAIGVRFAFAKSNTKSA